MPTFQISRPRTGRLTIFDAKNKSGKYRPHIGAKEQAKWAARHAPVAIEGKS